MLGAVMAANEYPLVDAALFDRVFAVAVLIGEVVPPDPAEYIHCAAAAGRHPHIPVDPPLAVELARADPRPAVEGHCEEGCGGSDVAFALCAARPLPSGDAGGLRRVVAHVQGRPSAVAG